MFDTLTDSLNGVFKKLRARGKLHPKQVDNALGDIRTALLEADVAVEVADDLVARVRARSLGEEVMKSLTPAQQVVKVVDEELTATMGGEHRPFELPVAAAGRDHDGRGAGVGEDHGAAKLAKLLKSKGRRPAAGRRGPRAARGGGTAPHARPGDRHPGGLGGPGSGEGREERPEGGGASAGATS